MTRSLLRGSPVIGAFQTQVPAVVGLRRAGAHRQPTAVVLSFGAALDPAAAGDVADYTIVPAGPAGRTGPHPRPVPIASAA